VKLSRLERKALMGAQCSHERGFFSVTQSALKNWKNYLWQVVLMGGAVGFYWWGGWRDVSMAFLGFLVGTLGRDLGWLFAYRRLWRVTDEITNWDRVQTLLAQNNISDEST
jgi:hypothetical protein